MPGVLRKVQNLGNVKFREFAGNYQMVAEVTHSQDRLDGLTEMLQATADAVGAVLESSRGTSATGWCCSRAMRSRRRQW